MARVYNHYPTGATPRYRGQPAIRHVKNLGWLLRHASEVNHICISKHAHNTARFSADGIHKIPFTNNVIQWTFVCDFADFNIACRWIKRPRFAHLTPSQISILT